MIFLVPIALILSTEANPSELQKRRMCATDGLDLTRNVIVL